ncbi:MAG: complexin-2 [Eubacteriales bacterium]
MKQIKISEELFIRLVKYHLLELETDKNEIEKELQKKLDSMIMRELYTEYKTASSEELKEKARQEYLDKRGVLDSFRW